MGAPVPNDDYTLEEALYELDRYRRGFENLERHVRVLDRERQKLAVVLNNARAGFLILDRHLRLTWANPMVATGSGLSPGHDLAGRACHEVLCRNDRPCADCPARQALDGVSPCHLEVGSDEHGPARRWHLSAAQIRSPHGTSEEVLVMIQDLTDLESLRRSEASLSAQKRILEMIARGEPLEGVLEALCREVEAESPEMICAINVIDPISGRFRHGAAPSLPPEYARSVEGVAIGEGVGACGTAAYRRARVVCPDLATDPFWEPARSWFVDTLGLRACWSTPIMGGPRVLGTFALYFRTPGAPRPRHEDLIETYTHLARIAIERDRAAEEKARLEAQLRQSQKMEAIGTLAGGVAHDFNNLMAGVLGYVSLLRQSPEHPERVLKAAAIIETAAQRASDLTTKLLGFARRGRYQSVPVNMNDVLGEVAGLLGRTIDKGIDLVVEPSRREPWIQGDPAQMHQVVLNLTVNARDAMGASGRMTLFARVDDAPGLSSGGWVVVGVSDTGPGIPPEIRTRIFEPFFTTKATGKGSGMGLATAYGIVQSHGGELAFETSERGTTFHFRLPLLDREAKPEAGARRVVPTVAPVPDSGRRKCVLVVDDEAMVREVCRDILEELGYEVLEAEDGVRGVEVYRRERARIDAVVLDMIMPRMGGRDCFRALKEANPDVRVVLVTGYADEDVTRQLVDEGMVGFLRKPYQVSQLAEVMAGALGKKH